MEEGELERLIYSFWVKERPKGFILENLAKYYNIPEESHRYMAFSEKSFLDFVKETYSLGVYIGRSGISIETEPELPDSLLPYKEDISNMLQLNKKEVSNE